MLWHMRGRRCWRHRLCLLASFICLGGCFGDVRGGRGGGGGIWECKGENCDKIPIPEGSPATLVSVGKRTVTSSGGSASMLVDGRFRGSATWNARAGDWVSIEVGGGIRELLFSWTASNNTDHPEIRWGAPAAYRVETSSDSSDGRNGTWVVAKEVSNNGVRTRTHRIAFESQRWLRFVVRSHEGTENGVQIDEMELHDNSDGKVDGWFFLGDSITAEAFTRAAPSNPAFATLLWAGDSSHYPIQMNGGYGGDNARCLRAPCSSERLEQALRDNEGIRVVAIALGTNDFGASEYRAAMSELIRIAQRHGKIAMVPRIPWARGRSEATQEAMNRVVDALRQEFNLPEGPDLYAHFRENPRHLRDDLHPNAEGQKAMNYLWVQAAMAAKAAGTLPKL